MSAGYARRVQPPPFHVASCDASWCGGIHPDELILAADPHGGVRRSAACQRAVQEARRHVAVRRQEDESERSEGD